VIAHTGHAYVVLGSRTNADLSVDSLGARGFAIAAEDEQAGFSVAGVGDLNGDWRDFGHKAGRPGWSSSPRRRPVRLARLGARGFRIRGARRGRG
jgi:hypothetical protein